MLTVRPDCQKKIPSFAPRSPLPLAGEGAPQGWERVFESLEPITMPAVTAKSTQGAAQICEEQQEQPAHLSPED